MSNIDDNATPQGIEAGGNSAGESKVAKAKEVVRDAVGRTGRAVGESYERLSNRARHMEAGVEDKIQHYPMSSVLIAMGVGVIVGFVLRDTLES